jgi:hypothetical protein
VKNTTNNMDGFDIEILTEGEVIDTYSGDFTYRDTGYINNDDGTYTFYYHDYGAKPSDGWEVNDDPDEIAELTRDIRQMEMKKNLSEVIKNDEFIHGIARLRTAIVNENNEVIVEVGKEGLITAYLPNDETFAVMFKESWHTFKESEETFKERFFIVLNEELN